MLIINNTGLHIINKIVQARTIHVCGDAPNSDSILLIYFNKVVWTFDITITCLKLMMNVMADDKVQIQYKNILLLSWWTKLFKNATWKQKNYINISSFFKLNLFFMHFFVSTANIVYCKFKTILFLQNDTIFIYN